MSIRAVGPGRWQLDYYDEHGKRGLAPEAPNPEGLTVADLTRWWLDGPARRFVRGDRGVTGLLSPALIVAAVRRARGGRR